MKKDSEKDWIRFLVLIYALAFCFLLVAAVATGFLLSHPEYGMAEKTLFIRALLSEYGLIVGLSLSILSNALPIFFFWPFFMLYLKLKRRYEWDNILVDSIAYSWMSAFGVSTFIFWLPDAINDVSLLLFDASPYIIVGMLESLGRIFYPMVAILFVVFLIVHYLMRRSDDDASMPQQTSFDLHQVSIKEGKMRRYIHWGAGPC